MCGRSDLVGSGRGGPHSWVACFLRIVAVSVQGGVQVLGRRIVPSCTNWQCISKSFDLLDRVRIQTQLRGSHGEPHVEHNLEVEPSEHRLEGMQHDVQCCGPQAQPPLSHGRFCKNSDRATFGGVLKYKMSNNVERCSSKFGLAAS